ncbi:hypothetical protein [uncultured Sulfitobacter sp.]|uniref:hypothetical protein n=1 Tax=uncultured Sulfitobacter sp. TaxID=191468 RepID=UPI0026131B76|nr:hypothetical protein [uncultured Sulfitobacter sp.]
MTVRSSATDRLKNFDGRTLVASEATDLDTFEAGFVARQWEVMRLARDLLGMVGLFNTDPPS